MKNRSIKRTELISDAVISPSTMQNLLHGRSVSLHTLEQICLYLDCSIDDIAECEK